MNRVEYKFYIRHKWNLQSLIDMILAEHITSEFHVKKVGFETFKYDLPANIIYEFTCTADEPLLDIVEDRLPNTYSNIMLVQPKLEMPF